jgi:LysR family glycine cleavage system transcriptional activator
MDLDDLRCFTAAADAPSFRAAARRVALSPAAFSTRIQRLEESLVARLFHRTTRQTSLTEAGQRLLPHARRLLADLDGCRSVVHAQRGPTPFAFTLGTRYELGLSWLCPALTELRRQRPERTLHLYMGDTPDLLARLERGDIDAVVSSARLTLARLSYAALHEERYVFVGTDQRLTGPDDAQTLTLVDVSPDLPLFRYLLDAHVDARPWPFAEQLYMGGIGAIRLRVLEGIGVAVLPEYFVREDLAAGRLRRLLPDVPLRTDAFRLVWRTGHPLAHELPDLASALQKLPLR